MLEIGLMIAMIILASSFAKRILGPGHTSRRSVRINTEQPGIEAEKLRAKERTEARALYERLVKEKLEVIKTAITMGYGRDDLKDLDARLEELIGKDKIDKLVDDTPTIPLADADLLDADLQAEIDRLARGREQA
jgi:hypothetical protein